MSVDLEARETRAELVARARELARLVWPDIPLRMGCVQVAASLTVVLATVGERSIVQGGTASWRRLPEDLDDGEQATHFSYVFEAASPTGLARWVRDLLPEMHVWVALPDRLELVDATICDLPEQCRIAGGLPWLTPEPEPFGWWRLEIDEPPGIYAPDVVACRVASVAVWRCIERIREALRVDE